MTNQAQALNQLSRKPSIEQIFVQNAMINLDILPKSIPIVQ